MLQYTEDVYEKDLAHALLLSKLEVEEKKVVGIVRHVWGCYSKVVELLNRQWCVYDLLNGGGASPGIHEEAQPKKIQKKLNQRGLNMFLSTDQIYLLSFKAGKPTKQILLYSFCVPQTHF